MKAKRGCCWIVARNHVNASECSSISSLSAVSMASYKEGAFDTCILNCLKEARSASLSAVSIA